MKLVIQRVTEASVTIEEQTVGKIGNGYLVLLGIGREDDEKAVEVYAEKMMKLRIFADENGKTNLSLADVGGELLVISQFTLYADCRKGNRPNFLMAGEPARAKQLYEYFVEVCKKRIQRVETGEFGAHMKISLVNDGPFTIAFGEGELG